MLAYERPPARVILANYATLDMRERCRALGAHAVFDKSTEIEDLVTWLAAKQIAFTQNPKWVVAPNPPALPTAVWINPSPPMETTTPEKSDPSTLN